MVLVLDPLQLGLLTTHGHQISCEKGIKSETSGNRVYYTACYVLVILKNSCSKFHCQVLDPLQLGLLTTQPL